MLRDTETRMRPSWLLLGPAFVAAIAYVDPGNVAANISAGAQFGFLLVWVIFVANAMAGLVQYLSAKLGLVSGRTLPEAVADHTRTPTRIGYWLQAELVAMATDLAEVVGGAIALHLLFDLPLLVGGIITGAVSLLLLAVQNRRGQRTFERVISGLLLVIAIGFLTSLFVEPPPLDDAAERAGAALRRRRERAAGHRDAGRDGDAARRLPALRPGPRPARPPRSRPAAHAGCCGSPASTSGWRCWWQARSTCRWC